MFAYNTDDDIIPFLIVNFQWQFQDKCKISYRPLRRVHVI